MRLKNNLRMDATQTTSGQDSVAEELAGWMADLPGVVPDVEAARQRVAKLARLLERELTRTAARHELTMGDWEALSFLQRSGPPYEGSPKELAAALGVTSGTMSVRIERLTHAGLVEPGVARPDGRNRPVRLTARGRERWRAATAERTDVEHALLGSALSAEEFRQLNPLLAKLLGHLEEEFGTAPRHGALRAD